MGQLGGAGAPTRLGDLIVWFCGRIKKKKKRMGRFHIFIRYDVGDILKCGKVRLHFI